MQNETTCEKEDDGGEAESAGSTESSLQNSLLVYSNWLLALESKLLGRFCGGDTMPKDTEACAGIDCQPF